MSGITFKTTRVVRPRFNRGWPCSERFKRIVITVPGEHIDCCDIQMYTQSVDGESTRAVTMDIGLHTFEDLLREMYQGSKLSSEHVEEVREQTKISNNYIATIDKNNSSGWGEGYKAGFLAGFGDGKGK